MNESSSSVLTFLEIIYIAASKIKLPLCCKVLQVGSIDSTIPTGVPDQSVIRCMVVLTIRPNHGNQ